MEKELRQNIFKRMKEIHMTQDRLAEILGLSKTSVSAWMNQRSTPKLSMLAEIAEALDTTPELLLFGSYYEAHPEGGRPYLIPIIDPQISGFDIPDEDVTAYINLPVNLKKELVKKYFITIISEEGIIENTVIGSFLRCIRQETLISGQYCCVVVDGRSLIGRYEIADGIEILIRGKRETIILSNKNTQIIARVEQVITNL
ncbi:MAG: helix-turn-helix domain-containing protein [Culicoidibacterales bacterium]